MNNDKREAALSELKNLRENLLTIVNTSIDSLITRLENGEEIETGCPLEITYPLSVSPALFKGTKPTAVLFGKERVEVNRHVRQLSHDERRVKLAGRHPHYSENRND